MRRFVALLVAAAALPAAASLVASQDALEERTLRAPVPVVVDGRRESIPIEVTVFRPRGAGPFPVVVLSHGSPRSASDRRRAGRIRFEKQSRELVSLGYAVVVPTRRGYGESGGEWAEGYGRCEDPDYHTAGLETARDIVAALEAVRSDARLDTHRVVLMGQSAGGWGSIAASALPVTGVVGVVNFAGGRGSRSAGEVCRAERLVDAAGRYGREARVEGLWIYSANDGFFNPELAQRMHAAFVKAGGRAELRPVPASGRDGHGYFERGIDEWSGPVGAFLRRVTGNRKEP